MSLQQASVLKDVDRYESRATGGWFGKNIGGTLGMPAEGNPGVLTYFYYDPVPTEPQANDDFEIQLIWLAMLRERGLRLVPADFPQYFDRHMAMTISEYQMAVRNHRDAIRPPMGGAHNNWFVNGMGATIRSEIWAMIAPGAPDIAAAYAYMDASMDHAGEGIWGEMFLAALESMAFAGEQDRPLLLEKALHFVPRDSQIARAVRLVLREWKLATHPVRVRHMVCAEVGHPMDFTWAPLNVGFIVIGLLYGEDFGDALCVAVNCGYDTDCTGASLGALLGIMAGREEIPDCWLKPIGDRVVISEGIRDLEFPTDIYRLTEATAELACQTQEDEGLREHLYRWTGLDFLRSGGPLVSVPPTTRVGLAAGEHLKVDLDYRDQAVIGPDEIKAVDLILVNEGSEAVDCMVNVDPDAELELVREQPVNGSGEGFKFSIAAGESLRAPFAFRLCPGAAPATDSAKVRFVVVAAGQEAIEAEFGLARRICWLVTEPIDAADLATRGAIELAGRIDNAGVRLNCRRLEGYSLNSFIPEPGQVVYAQVEVELDQDEGERVIANNSGPIRVWLDGEQIIDKPHRMHGIMPSWHLQSNPLHGYTMDTFGCADVLMRKGRHRFLVRLEGRSLEQDVMFYLAGMNLGAEGELISDRRMLKPFSRAAWVDVNAVG